MGSDATSGDPTGRATLFDSVDDVVARLADVGYLCATWTQAGDPPSSFELSPVTRLPGFPGRAELVARYEERSGRPSGKDITEGLVPEELDMGTHLLGSSRVLKNFTSSGSGGLAEACFWVVLRQDMFISLTRSTPPSAPLENIMGSRAFTEFDPESIANRMVYLCSRILS